MELEGFKIGDEFNINIKSEKLSYVNNENSLQILKEDDWKYKDSENEDLDLYKFDLSKMSYSITDLDTQKFYYYDYETNSYKKYLNLQNVILDIDNFNQEILNKVNKEYDEYSNISSTSSLDSVIHPFNIFKYDKDGKPIEFSFIDLTSGTNNWINIALNEGLLKNNFVTSKSQKKLKVVGIEKLYDSNKIYLEQLYANQLLGFNKSFDSRQKFENGNSINIWSNAKMSKNRQISDQMQRLILNSINSNNASVSFDKYFNSAIGYTDYIKVKKEAIENLITSIILISTIFITISMITAMIVIYLITDLFIGRYKKFMSYMRIQGYTMKEINSIILWIFLPIAILAVSLGIIVIWLITKYLVPSVLLNLNIAVPLTINIALFPVVLLAGVFIFAIAYTIVMILIKRIRLSSLIGNE
ncbi:ABC transporter permease [Spiroplasma taiwanense]|uniref:ABC transporter permease n=1 Tax=Spiroplasma taiwanense TaxID=2145 RepID=UPI00040E2DD8|nr:ABC transporter permease [Spiroplasma taiwanense]